MKAARLYLDGCEVQLSKIEVSKASQVEEFQFTFKYYQKKLLEITRVLSNSPSKESIKQAVEDHKQLSPKIFKLQGLVKKMPKEVFEEYSSQFESQWDYVKQTRIALIQAGRGNIGSEMIAILNNMAYQERLEGKKNKVLQKRILKNQQKEQEEATELIGYDQQEFAKQNSELVARFGSCFMDLTDLSEIVEFQGCFCLTFDIKRPAAAVFDPF